MRILLLFLFVLSSNVSIFSQEYIPMLQEDNVWGIDSYADGGTISNDFYFEGEETVNGITYKISNEGCLMREDGGVVYFYDDFYDDELVMLDFTLEAGDVVPSIDQVDCFANFSTYYGDIEIVTTTTEFIAGLNRKIMNVEIDGDTEIWIEGIGSTMGLSPGNGGPSVGRALVCFTKNGETTFFNGATMCDNTFLGVDDLSKDKVTLLPNPITTVAILKLSQSLPNASIKYYDLNGKLIQEAKITDDEVLISRDDFVTGMYFYQIYKDTKVEHSGKFLVK